MNEYYEQNEQELIDRFLIALWDSKFKFKKYKKYFKFKVDEQSLGYNQELIDLFNKYNNISYYVCRSKYKDIKSIDYIKIHINNTYGYLCDKDVYLKKEYYQKLIIPKKEYFKTIKAIKNGHEINIEKIKLKIENALQDAEDIKKKSRNRKIALKQKDYNKLISGFVERIFSNYVPLSEYEKNHEYETDIYVDGWNEDNYIISYFCKSITGYMKTYVRQIQGIKQGEEYIECCKCGVLVEKKNNRHMYCSSCWKKVRQCQNREKALKYYHKTKNFTI